MAKQAEKTPPEAVQTPPKEGVSSVSLKAETPKSVKTVLVTQDTTIGDLLELNSDREVQLHFDVSKFRQLPEPVIQDLTAPNRKAYYTAWELWKREQEALVSIVQNPIDAIDYELARAKQIRPREGWTSTWLTPEDLEAVKPLGYKEVRNPTSEQIKNGFKAGEENGEIKKIRRGDVVEQIACECPASVSKSIMQGMADKSQQRLRNSTATARENLMELNERAGGSRRNPLMAPVEKG